MSGPALEEVACNLCGSRESRVRFSAMNGWPQSGAGHFAATTDVYGAYGTVRACGACGLLYTSPRLKAGELLSEYETTKDEDYFSEAESRSINAYMSLAAIRRHAPKGRLLDVGCSTGFFLNAARLAYEVEGVEPSRWARQFAKDQLNLPGIHPTLEAARFPDGRFDVVSLNDVIEHVPDPLGLMKEVARVTRKGGLLYLVTPDIESLSAKLLGGRWWGLRPAHIYYFSPETLRDLLKKSGFEVVELRSYGRIFTWKYWLSRLAHYPRWISGTAAGFIRFFGLEDKFLYIDTRDSMQVVARKS